MKVLFVGPSLSGCTFDAGDLILRAPARQGDLRRAVQDGVAAIGLVDGLFDSVAAVWHKEILYALASGVRVLGAASIGALRAAECFEFGMEPVGVIAASYVSGERRDDADVCLAHCPRELGYAPLSEPLVDVEATIDRLLVQRRLTPIEASSLLVAARGLFFGDRTVAAMLRQVRLAEPRRQEIAAAYERHRVSRKAEDALLLVQRLQQVEDVRTAPAAWAMRETVTWRRLLDRLGPPEADPA